jgi:hypothetical protein
MKKIFSILLALSAFSIVISGCKKNEEPAAGTDGTKPGTETPAPAPAETPAK